MTDSGTAKTSDHCDIAIIGGGASGMAAALYAHEHFVQQTHRECSISLFERNDRLGKKLLATGNGRCNLTNLNKSLHRYHGSNINFAQNALTLFSPEKIIAIFEEMGVLCTVEEGQKIYPASLHASSVLDALRLALDEKGIRQYKKTMIKSLSKVGNQFVLHASSEKTYTASAAIVATGGMCAPATGSDGSGYKLLTSFSHELVEPVPSIVQLTTDTRFVKPLSGNKIPGRVSLYIDSQLIRKEEGEILFTDYGISGPPVLQLSGYVSRALHEGKNRGELPKITVELDFLPSHSLDEVIALLNNRRNAFRHRTLEEYLTGLFQRRLSYGLLKASIGKQLSATVAQLTDEEIVSLAHACKALLVLVSGTKSFANAQTTAGGIRTSDFEAATMESNKCKGLFACGEILDIDGDCGGFNLQWAWASGFLAGSSAATYLAGI
jgi:predicted Rossmann fold flavoprotein